MTTLDPSLMTTSWDHFYEQMYPTQHEAARADQVIPAVEPDSQPQPSEVYDWQSDPLFSSEKVTISPFDWAEDGENRGVNISLRLSRASRLAINSFQMKSYLSNMPLVDRPAVRIALHVVLEENSHFIAEEFKAKNAQEISI